MKGRITWRKDTALKHTKSINVDLVGEVRVWAGEYTFLQYEINTFKDQFSGCLILIRQNGILYF
ncbi:MAG: hypothetical protein A2W85_08755 [Bacteroidetes bacterium GWF2_41_31]|nr:MAG: hypothetical protein A2W85_08755 [Bacteroidetes bacterium GWF2_41_31]